MEPLTAFLGSRGRIHATLKTCETYGFYTPFYNQNNYANRVCSYINPNKNICLLQTSLDFCKAMKHHNSIRKMLSKMMVSYYIDDIAYEQSMWVRIHDLMLAKKTIFIIIDLEQYLLAQGTNRYDSHSVCVILHPSSENHYDLFYINSHGRCLFGENNQYDIVTLSTKSRTKYGKINLPYAPDFILMRELHSYLQKTISQLGEPIFTIHYDMTEKHNYLRYNIQSGDNHGICFVFPYIIWYYLVTNFEQPRSFGEMTIPSSKTLLETKNINDFVPSCFIEMSAGLRNMFLSKKADEDIEEYLEKKHTFFLKQILCPFINYMTQPYFVEQFHNMVE